MSSVPLERVPSLGMSVPEEEMKIQECALWILFR